MDFVAHVIIAAIFNTLSLAVGIFIGMRMGRNNLNRH